MTSSENLETWNFRPSFADSWISEIFSRDTETLTKALQKSLSNYSDTVTGDDYSSPVLNMAKPETTSSLQNSSVSGSDPETPVPKRRNGVANGKVTKRKSRATRRSTTTFITADPANFRQLVQQVTGVSFVNGQLPVAPLLKPEPQRAFNGFQGCLPTLDTSAFLLDHHQQVAGPTSTAMGYTTHTPPGTAAVGGAGFDFESFSSFPTLESWKVM